jgi:hypothetical protein
MHRTIGICTLLTLLAGSPALPQQNDDATEFVSAVSSIRSINTAEKYYAEHYSDRGYACDLATLGVPPAGEKESADHAGLLAPALTNGLKLGYKFTLQCGSHATPQRSYSAYATPLTSHGKAVCSDESGILKSSDDGNAKTCQSSGNLLQ